MISSPAAYATFVKPLRFASGIFRRGSAVVFRPAPFQLPRIVRPLLRLSARLPRRPEHSLARRAVRALKATDFPPMMQAFPRERWRRGASFFS